MANGKGLNGTIPGEISELIEKYFNKKEAIDVDWFEESVPGLEEGQRYTDKINFGSYTPKQYLPRSSRDLINTLIKTIRKDGFVEMEELGIIANEIHNDHINVSQLFTCAYEAFTFVLDKIIENGTYDSDVAKKNMLNSLLNLKLILPEEENHFDVIATIDAFTKKYEITESVVDKKLHGEKLKKRNLERYIASVVESTANWTISASEAELIFEREEMADMTNIDTLTLAAESYARKLNGLSEDEKERYLMLAMQSVARIIHYHAGEFNPRDMKEKSLVDEYKKVGLRMVRSNLSRQESLDLSTLDEETRDYALELIHKAFSNYKAEKDKLEADVRSTGVYTNLKSAIPLAKLDEKMREMDYILVTLDNVDECNTNLKRISFNAFVAKREGEIDGQEMFSLKQGLNEDSAIGPEGTAEIGVLLGAYVPLGDDFKRAGPQDNMGPFVYSPERGNIRVYVPNFIRVNANKF